MAGKRWRTVVTGKKQRPAKKNQRMGEDGRQVENCKGDKGLTMRERQENERAKDDKDAEV